MQIDIWLFTSKKSKQIPNGYPLSERKKTQNSGYEANSGEAIKILELMSFNEETDVIMVKQVTNEMKELIKRTYAHKVPYIYDDFTCKDAMILSQFKMTQGDVARIPKPTRNATSQVNGQHRFTNNTAGHSLFSVGAFTTKQNTREIIQCLGHNDKNEATNDETHYSIGLKAEMSELEGKSLNLKGTYEHDYSDGGTFEISGLFEIQQKPDGTVDKSAGLELTLKK